MPDSVTHHAASDELPQKVAAAPTKVSRRQWNPLASLPRATSQSSYAGWVDGALRHPLDRARPPTNALLAMHEELQQRILGEGYPCVGARSALNRRTYRLGLYPPIGSADAVLALCHDLYEFSHEFPDVADDFLTFIAGFDGPILPSEHAFEEALWCHLQEMHKCDVAHFGWDHKVSADPADSRFSFSVGGRAYFVIGLHPAASRSARAVSRPTLVFNLHEQFERLRERGKFETMKKIIRARDFAFQGSINPVLKDFGEFSEARQYSGRAVPDDWVCPFHARKP